MTQPAVLRFSSSKLWGSVNTRHIFKQSCILKIKCWYVGAAVVKYFTLACGLFMSFGECRISGVQITKYSVPVPALTATGIWPCCTIPPLDITYNEREKKEMIDRQAGTDVGFSH